MIRQIALRLRDTINAIDCPKIGQQTASYGLSTLKEDDILGNIVHRADEALFLAKARGKNRLEIVT